VAIPSKNNLHPATPSTDRDTLLEDRLRALELPSDEQHGGEEAFTAAFANMLKTLAFLVGALLLASWMLKKFLATRNQQLNGAGSIKILEQRPLSHRTALYIVEIEEKRFVLAESAQGVSLLTELSSDIQPSP
jgi:flagellar biosynthetic protein FliO